jgi:hypothetical protein
VEPIELQRLRGEEPAHDAAAFFLSISRFSRKTCALMSKPDAHFEEFLAELRAQLKEVRAAQVRAPNSTHMHASAFNFPAGHTAARIPHRPPSPAQASKFQDRHVSQARPGQWRFQKSVFPLLTPSR